MYTSALLQRAADVRTAFTNLIQKFLANKYAIPCIWVVLAVIITTNRINVHSINNYLIFKYAFLNAIEQRDLYTIHTQFYLDTNHYGPLFSVIMAPFAILPDILQIYVWQIINAALLFFAIHKLPLSISKRNLICVLCTQELYTSLSEFQTNGAIAALIILSWVFTEKRRVFWAAFFIMVGFYVKLYGIVGIAFFLFADKKMAFALSLVFWAVVLFVLPMAFFSPGYVINSYTGWYHSLVHKNQLNLVSLYQDVSVAGMVRKLSGNSAIPALPFIVAGLLLQGMAHLKFAAYKQLSYRYMSLASVLLFTVLFSSGSELVTYIIAFAGVGIWFVTLSRPVNTAQILLLVFVLYFGSLYATDIFPRSIKMNVIRPYGLKALPYLLVWLMVMYQMTFNKQYTQPGLGYSNA